MIPKFLLGLLFISTVCAKGIDSDNKTITISLGEEPPTLDSSLSEDTSSTFVLSTIHEGLVRIDSRGDIKPGIAESWVISESGAIFNLRDNAKWSDGKKITAHDFVYSWQRLVDPSTGASGSTFFAYMFKNGAEILKGEVDKSELGVKALDSVTLEVTTSRYIPYLLKALATINYVPLREDFVNLHGDRFAAEFDKILFSGPFVLSSWVHGASLGFSKNPNYWNAEAVSLKSIQATYITSDKRALLNLFQANELATLSLNASVLDDAVENGYRIRKKANHCSSILTLNHRSERPTSNKNLRKALQYSFDPATYVNRIISLPGTTPSYSVFSSYLKADGAPFTERYPITQNIPDAGLAKHHLALAKTELGKLPTLVLLSREGREKADEYLQALFMESLGIEVKIDRQSFKQAIVRLINGDFDIAFSGFCSGTVDDPFIAATNYTSAHPYNDGRFKNQAYDRLFEFTNNSSNQPARMKAFAEMQMILFEEAVVLPTHESSDIYVQDPKVRRLYYGANWDFSWARIR